jgi:hypothetical protein
MGIGRGEADLGFGIWKGRWRRVRGPGLLVPAGT